MRQICLAIGSIGLSVAGWHLLAYEPVTVAISFVVSVPLLFFATKGCWVVGVAFSVLCASLFWAAFGTTAGYFWFNRDRLDKLVVDIQSTPAIASMELGHDRAVSAGDGTTGRFDSYRFINGQLVTQYRRQVAPVAHQPSFYENDVLRDLGVPLLQYQALRASLERLRMSGFWRGADGEVVLNELMPGGTPWANAFVYRPAERSLVIDEAMEPIRLAENWFYVTFE